MSTLTHVNIEVVLAEAVRLQRLSLSVPIGTTARNALLQAVDNGLDVDALGISIEQAPMGVYAVRVTDDYVMNEGDRLEVYRPLAQDPMELRRQRAKRDAQRRKK